ncbi:MAG: NADPH-dependent F420 reductase [Deltaproteobacteria bacterium]|nr:NADPH-dependent F420 reductase [Deltaproteobacteria bacterium]
MKIAMIGTGNVGAPLAQHLAEAGHDVVLAESKEGSRSLESALKRTPKLQSRPLTEAVAWADVVFVATPFGAHESVLGPIASLLDGKVLVDCTNPIGPGLTHGLGSERSGSAAVQAMVPGAKVVKAFSIYGFENLEDPRYPGYDVRPTMMFCGDDSGAKATVATLIDGCGFEPLDVGGLVQALHLEHMTLLWVRMVRVHGHSPHIVWAALERPRGR